MCTLGVSLCAVLVLLLIAADHIGGSLSQGARAPPARSRVQITLYSPKPDTVTGYSFDSE